MVELLWDWIPWGYRLLLEIERWRTPFLDGFFGAVTQLGYEQFYIALLAVFYWCVDKQAGLMLTYVNLLSTYLNAWIKASLDTPRPGWPAVEETLKQAGITQRLTPLFQETSAAWPSNHAQGAMVAWGFLGWYARRWWSWLLTISLILLISFSRLYGGVHFPQDVIGGLLIGLVFLSAYLALVPVVARWLGGLSLAVKLALALGLPAVGVLLTPSRDAALLMGTASGMTIGYLAQEQTVRFDSGGRWPVRALRAGLGLVGVFAIYLGLGALFDALSGGEAGLLLRAVRFGLLGLTASWLLPWLFVKLRLADRLPSAESAPTGRP